MKQKWFKISLEEGWEPLKIICRIFLSNDYFYNYISKFNLSNEVEGPACTIGFKKQEEYNKIEICLSADFLSRMIIAHELQHATNMYLDHYIPDAFMGNVEEWSCIVNGWIHEEFYDKLEKHFDIID